MDILERVYKAARHEEPDKVPVVLLAYSLILKRFRMIKEYDYYQDVKVQLDAKVTLQKRFPEVWFVGTSMYPEYGNDQCIIPTAFNAELKWMKDAPPWVEPKLKTLEDVEKLISKGIPEPKRARIGSVIFQRLQYFYDWFPRELRENYGYIEGQVACPYFVEGAALSLGYDKFIVWMYTEKNLIHKLLKFTTKFMEAYCEEVENILGNCKVLWMPDHMASMVGKEQFNEFVLPYYNKIFSKYNKALRIWHNEGKQGHMLDEINKIEADVWQFGAKDNPKECKEKTHFCLMGNLDPPTIMLKGRPDDVKEEARKVILACYKQGGLWLSAGGGLAPETPFKNIDALLKAAEKYGKYH